MAVLAALRTAPTPQDVDAQEAAVTTTNGDQDQTFADLFEQMRSPEGHGEGHGAVAVAAGPPDIPSVPGQTAPAPAAAPVDLPDTVTAVRPALVVRGVDPAMAAAIAQVEGVTAAAGATVGEITVSVPGGTRTVSVAAVEPTAFRPLTPEMTANEPAVWERLVAGDAAFTHDAGTRLTVPLGSTITASAPGTNEPAGASGEGNVPAVTPPPATEQVVPPTSQATAPTSDEAGVADLRLGALASNGIPPVADALVSTEVGAQLGLTGPADVYVGVGEGVDEAAVRDAIAALTGVEVEEIAPPETQTTTFGAFLVGAEARNFFEPFDYIDHGDGLITIDQGWVDRNIASTTMIPLLNGTVTCHRQFLEQLYAAMSEVQAAGLGDLIDPSQYGGCWVARHIDWNPTKPISMHGWGLAVDLNVSTNQLGARPTMDPRIVEIFDRWGFVWGGRWNRPDGMHVELGAVIDVPVPEGFFR